MARVEIAFGSHNSTSTVLNSILVPEVKEALVSWIKNSGGSGVLIGGLALSFYVKPRYTADVDLLFLEDSDIPDTVPHFKRMRKHAFQDNRHHVEIETTTTALFANVTQALVLKVIQTATRDSGIRIASKEGLVALKLCAARMQDKADIVSLLKEYPNMKLVGWPLTTQHKLLLVQLRKQAKKETDHGKS